MLKVLLKHASFNQSLGANKEHEFTLFIGGLDGRTERQDLRYG